jgi:hypothetical protein
MTDDWITAITNMTISTILPYQWRHHLGFDRIRDDAINDMTVPVMAISVMAVSLIPDQRRQYQ